MPKFLNHILISCLFLFLTSPFAVAQSSTATLSGTVEDTNGQVIPNATVTISDLAKGFERKATTNDSGSFTFVLLPASTYTILVEQTGFGRAQLESIVLNVGDQKALQIQLKVGDVTAAIEVRADPSLIDTGGDVGTVIDNQFVKTIPMSGRTFHTLLGLTPGVVVVGGQINVNGQRSNSNYFTVDGVGANGGIPSSNNNSPSVSAGPGASGQFATLTAVGTTASLVSVDALQEFRVLTSSFAAEYGRTPGAQVQLVTKSGTNDFHGSAFEYIRNEAFEANDWFANRLGLKRPPTRQHLFGGTIGGPLPFFNFGDGGGPLFHSGKDRTHFFFSYEGQRLRLPKTLVDRPVPTLCFRGVEACQVGVDQPAPNAQLHPFLQAFPHPNGPEFRASCNPTQNPPSPLCVHTPGQPANVGTMPTGFARFSTTYSDPSSYDATIIRIDHTSGPLTFFGKYNQTPSVSSARQGSGAYVSSTTFNSRGVTLGSTWSAAKSVLNDIRINYATNDTPFEWEVPGLDGGVRPDTFGFLGRSPETGQFQFIVSSIPGAPGSAALIWGKTVDFRQRQFNLVDNLSWTLGDHQLKFGADFRRTTPLLVSGLGGQEVLSMQHAQLVRGEVGFYRIDSYDTERHVPVFDNFSLYAQDTWRVNKRLVLTYGVRWEFVPVPHAAEGPEAITLDGLDAPDIFAPNALGVAPIGTPLWRTRYNNFAPRFGASYIVLQKPGRELVLRGGVGTFYDLGLGNVANLYSYSWPWTGQIQYPIAGSACGSTLRFPLPACALVPAAPGSGFPLSMEVMDRELMLPRTYQWNFSAEQSLGSHQSITISYVGASGRELIKTSRYPGIRLRGVPYIGTGGTEIRVQRNAGRSNYGALQMQFQRRLSRGLQALVAYTYSHSKDDASDDGTGFAPGGVLPEDYDYGYSNFDVRHNFNAAVTYRIPALRLSFLEVLTRDWQVAARYGWRSGLPINVTAQMTVPGFPIAIPVRVNRVPGQPFWTEDSNAAGGRRLNHSAFAVPPAGTLGDLPRGLIRGFGLRQLDVSLSRELPLVAERVRLQLRWDVFNVTNTPNFRDVGGGFFNPLTLPQNFGGSTGIANSLGTGSNNNGNFNTLYNSGGPRSMQFSARVTF